MSNDRRHMKLLGEVFKEFEQYAKSHGDDLPAYSSIVLYDGKFIIRLMRRPTHLHNDRMNCVEAKHANLSRAVNMLMDKWDNFRITNKIK
jgi:hypothetical protein